MNEQKNESSITQDSKIKDVLDALNSGVTIDMMAISSEIRKNVLMEKIKNAGIREDKPGHYIIISNHAMDKNLGDTIKNVENIGKKREEKKEQIRENNLEQLNVEIRKFMVTDKEKAKQYKPSKEVWRQVKILQKYLFNVQQDWLLDALISSGLKSLRLPEDLKIKIDKK